MTFKGIPLKDMKVFMRAVKRVLNEEYVWHMKETGHG